MDAPGSIVIYFVKGNSASVQPSLETRRHEKVSGGRFQRGFTLNFAVFFAFKELL